MAETELTDEEMAVALSDAARRGSPSIKVQAVRLLLELRKTKTAAGEPAGDLDQPVDGLAALDSLEPRRRARGRTR
jgi:hypothetical protein